MKFYIGHRLFLAVLLSFAVVGVTGMALVRGTFFDSFSTVPAEVQPERLDDLISALTVQYRQHRSWSFLPENPASRKVWLREELRRIRQPPGTEHGESSRSFTLGYRIVLLDKDMRRMSGAIANPVMVAIASIDTIRQSIIVDGKVVGYLLVAKPKSQGDELAVAFLIEKQKDLFVIATISVLLSALSAVLLAMKFRKPIQQLVEGVRKLESAQFDTRLAIRSRDELGELGGAFNRLAERLQDEERARRTWVADTSHELRTPLSVLLGQMESLQDGIRLATPENIAVMLRQVHALTRLVDELYELARADIGQVRYEKAEHDIWQIVLDVVNSYTETFRVNQLVVTMDAPPARSVIHCDGGRIRQVATNLIENCVRYTDADGRIDIRAAVVDGELRVTFDDSAPGVPSDALKHMGERFFRVEPSRNRKSGGTGLGLALSKQIIEAHDGRLEFGLSPLGGLRAAIILRLVD